MDVQCSFSSSRGLWKIHENPPPNVKYPARNPGSVQQWIRSFWVGHGGPYTVTGAPPRGWNLTEVPESHPTRPAKRQRFGGLKPLKHGLQWN